MKEKSWLAYVWHEAIIPDLYYKDSQWMSTEWDIYSEDGAGLRKPVLITVRELTEAEAAKWQKEGKL